MFGNASVSGYIPQVPSKHMLCASTQCWIPWALVPGLPSGSFQSSSGDRANREESKRQDWPLSMAHRGNTRAQAEAGPVWAGVWKRTDLKLSGARTDIRGQLLGWMVYLANTG